MGIYNNRPLRKICLKGKKRLDKSFFFLIKGDSQWTPPPARCPKTEISDLNQLNDLSDNLRGQFYENHRVGTETVLVRRW